MDPQVEKHLQEFVEDIQTTGLKGIEERMKEKAVGIEQKCYLNHSNNVDKFANCMAEHSKRITKATQRLEIKINFYTKNLLQCLSNQHSQQAFTDCKDTSKTEFKAAVDELFEYLR